MAQEILFWKLNSNRTKHLIDFLDQIDEPLGAVRGYEDWDDISKIKFNNPKYYFKIYQKIKENINQIDVGELRLIVGNYFLRIVANKPSHSSYSEDLKKYHNDLKKVGIEFLAEIPSKSPAQEFIHTFNSSAYYLKNEHLITFDDCCGRNGYSNEIIKNLKFVNYCAGTLTLNEYYKDGGNPKNDYQMILLEIEMEELSVDSDLNLIFTDSRELKFPLEELHDFICNEWIAYHTTKTVIEAIKNHNGNVIVEDTNC